MDDPERAPRLDAFFRDLRRAGGGLLLLDYDGTLAPFREERLEARPWPGLAERVARIRELGPWAPVIISGRPAAEVASLVGIEPLPEIWGCHGWERRGPDGTFDRADPVPEAVAGLRAAHDAAADLVPPGRVEHKGAAIAVHFRGMPPERARELEAGVGARWRELVGGVEALEIRPFDGGIEVRAGARDKGSAVRALLGRVPEGTPAAYLGDDRTDEDAFEALEEAGGLAVLVRDEPGRSAASVRLRPPHEVRDFLDRWIATLAPREEA